MSPVPFDPARPFTTRQALAAGVSPGQLRGPGYRRLGKGVHVHATTPVTSVVLVRAALVSHPPDAFASHHSAAVVYGLPVPPHPLVHVSVFSANDRRRRRDIACHLAPAGTRVLDVRGTRVPVPAQVLVELAAHLPLVDLVVRRRDRPEGLVLAGGACGLLRRLLAPACRPSARRCALRACEGGLPDGDQAPDPAGAGRLPRALGEPGDPQRAR